MRRFVLWVGVLVLGIGLAVPTFAEDRPMEDWTGGQMAEAPPVVTVEPIPPTPEQLRQEELDRIDPLRLREKHGDKVYLHPDDGMAFTYGSQDGRVLTAEEAAADAERLGIEHIEATRKWLDGAVPEAKQKYRKFGEPETLEINAHDDVKVEEAVNATIAEQRKFEQGINERTEKWKEETRKVVPLRTLRSFEASQQASEQK